MAATGAALLLLASCTPPPSIGDPDEIVVVTTSRIWTALESEIVAAVEPRTFTVREERIFRVIYVQPSDTEWSDLRRMRQVLVIGTSEEPVVAEALGRRGAEDVAAPAVIQVPDLWAGNQLVTVALLPDCAEPRALVPLLPRISELYRLQLDRAVRIAMAGTPTNEQLADRLATAAGFRLDLPYGYDEEQPEPGVFAFRHYESGASPIERTIIVNSRSRGDVDWTPETARAWRAQLAERYHRPAQETRMLSSGRGGRVAGRRILHVQGVWSNATGEWPGGGPFVTRMVDCGDRLYLVDASLYAPGDRKYTHLYRLNMILDTFECSAAVG